MRGQQRSVLWVFVKKLFNALGHVLAGCAIFVCDGQVEAGSDAPSESKVDQRVTLPAENGLSHTPIIAPKPPSLVGHQPQSAGN